MNEANVYCVSGGAATHDQIHTALSSDSKWTSLIAV